jgi:hypothetical protein
MSLKATSPPGRAFLEPKPTRRVTVTEVIAPHAEHYQVDIATLPFGER